MSSFSLSTLMIGLLLLSAAPAAGQSTADTASPASADTATAPQPPDAQKQPKRLEKFGDVRIDNYYWLRERENPAVRDYLEAENAYTEAMTAHTEALQDTIFEEIKTRIPQTDQSVPYRLDDYFYYSRVEEGQQYPIYARKKESLEAEEQVMLDVNQLAEGHDFFAVGNWEVSSGQDILAYAADTTGRRIYTIRFKNLGTGEVLKDEIPAVTPNMAWAEDNRTLFYAKQDPQTLRYYQIYRHTLGTPASLDELVYEEKDDTFSAYVFKTKSKKYLMIAAQQTLASEYRFLDAANPTGDFQVIAPRERGHEYSADHYGDAFYIRTNSGGAENFRLMKTPVTAPAQQHWTEVIPHRADVFLEDFELFAGHLVLEERKSGLIELRVRPWEAPSEAYYIDFEEPAYAAGIGANPAFDTQRLRYNYTSMTTPGSVYDYDMAAREATLKKRDAIGGGFDADDYRTERLFATAEDGTEVPVSVVYKKGTPLDGTAPLLLYGYGSYGNSLDAAFSAARLSLLDRGFVYAIAHVRGGEEMGRAWYESGKLLNKKNTFTDFIASAEHLIENNYADPERLYAMGGSAGGLLMGAVVNMRPELWDGVVAAVPFVDVVTTMLDDTIPLTTSEYDEWGNPNEEKYYDYIRSYSPYDKVEKEAYPAMLVTTGLADSQVQYWEPAKWVAKLRDMKTGDALLLLKTNMEAGHGGASGRYEAYRETAFEYAFLIDQARPKGAETASSE